MKAQKVIKITGPLQSVRYWNGEAYRLISWDEDENTAMAVANTLAKRDKVKVVLNNTTYGVYHREK